MAKSQIDIQVSDNPPQVSGNKQFSWKLHSSLVTDPLDRSLSLQLFGCESTLAILREAFASGLTRDMSWDLSGIDQYLRPSFEAAARVYKRGVPIEGMNPHVRVASYPITFSGDLSRIFSRFDARDFFVVDAEVARHWWPQLPSGFIAVEFSESRKNIDALGQIVALLREHQSQGEIRHVVIVGGGVAGDVVGFACGLLGLNFHFIPTTLLSMVDSSIGGKVGVNFEPWGKNQIGLFCHPSSVHVWSGWLSTLNETEIKSGVAEALKHALLNGNKDLWSKLINSSKTHSWNLLGDLFYDVINFKAQVVMRDPFEMGERAILNFGHTLGHAVESLAIRRGMNLTHGSCVALGMIHALRLSEKKYGFNAAPFINDIMEAKVLPEKDHLEVILQFPLSEIQELLASDKKSKNLDASFSFVLLSASGLPAKSSNGEWVISISIQEALQGVADTFDFLDV